MKKYTTPAIAELNVAETANGIFDTTFESLIILNDNKKPVTPVTPVTPVQPVDPTDPVINENS